MEQYDVISLEEILNISSSSIMPAKFQWIIRLFFYHLNLAQLFTGMQSKYLCIQLFGLILCEIGITF